MSICRVLFLSINILLSLNTGALGDVSRSNAMGANDVKRYVKGENISFAFMYVTSICIDSESNIYIMDTGFNKIFKFDNKHKYIGSIGEPGEGYGQLNGSSALGRHLRLSLGNDGLLYVVDPGNRKIVVYSRAGKVITQHKVNSKILYDTPAITSKGELIFFSRSGIKLIDKYDNNLDLIINFFEFEKHAKFAFPDITVPSHYIRTPSEYELIKLISSNDYIYLISNYAMKAYVYNDQGVLKNAFDVGTKEIKDDLFERLKRQKLIAATSYILPFRAFNNDNSVFIVYKMSNGSYEVLGYSYEGLHINTRIIENINNVGCMAANRDGYTYIATDKYTRISVYK